VPTGGLINKAKNWMALQGGDANVQQLDEITSRIAPAQRQPGAGTTSDTDLRLYLNASPNKDSAKAANDAIVERGRREAVLRQQRSEFYDKYVQEHGTLNGAEPAFRSMIGLGAKENPYTPEQAGDRTQLPRGAYYNSPEGLRRNDNGPRGNPIVRARATAAAARSNGASVQVASPDEARKLPPGTRFTTPDGREFVR
jgi:hypothetical protein